MLAYNINAAVLVCHPDGRHLNLIVFDASTMSYIVGVDDKNHVDRTIHVHIAVLVEAVALWKPARHFLQELHSLTIRAGMVHRTIDRVRNDNQCDALVGGGDVNHLNHMKVAVADYLLLLPSYQAVMAQEHCLCSLFCVNSPLII